MDLKPEDIVAALAGNQTLGEPGAPVTGRLWHNYWQEVGRWAPWLGMAVGAPSANQVMAQALARNRGEGILENIFASPQAWQHIHMKQGTNPLPLPNNQTPGVGGPFPPGNINLP